MNKVSAEWAIRAEILARITDLDRDVLAQFNEEELDDLWDRTNDSNEDDMYDELYQFRSDGEETNLPAPSSRHYEADQVACQTPFGWVSWTYWYGGGKFGNPEEIDWIEDAFYVDCFEEEKLVVVREFRKVAE